MVVNDASSDETAQVCATFPSIAILNHWINLGAGAATKTGIDYAISQNAKYIVTIDADGQHSPSDIERMAEALENNNADLVVGSRFLRSNPIPNSRIFYNQIGNLVSLALTGKYLTDSQSGLKIMTSDLAKKISIEYNGFEFSMEIIKNAKLHKAKIIEIPVNVTYTQETTEKGQNLNSGINMIKRILSPF